jgi:hypothetical protein
VAGDVGISHTTDVSFKGQSMLDCFSRYVASSRLKYLVMLRVVSLVLMEVG